jgi:hypothetical protein
MAPRLFVPKRGFDCEEVKMGLAGVRALEDGLSRWKTAEGPRHRVWV